MLEAHTQKFRTLLGPIIISALSLFISSIVINFFSTAVDPAYYILANRSIGKILFTILVIFHILMLMWRSNNTLRQHFVESSFLFFSRESWIAPFFLWFSLFFLLHGIVLLICLFLGYAMFVPLAANVILNKIPALLAGFIATFFLAWTEELIFRSALYLYLAQALSPINAALLASAVFALAHNLTNPLLLVTAEWQLGFGLFLLGFILNLLFILTKKLYVGMGVHAGLVYVKVVLRRLPFITLSPTLPFFIDGDLRKSLLIHALFIVLIIVLMVLLMRKEYLYTDKI